jgi:hypothetical protein
MNERATTTTYTQSFPLFSFVTFEKFPFSSIQACIVDQVTFQFLFFLPLQPPVPFVCSLGSYVA